MTARQLALLIFCALLVQQVLSVGTVAGGAAVATIAAAPVGR